MNFTGTGVQQQSKISKNGQNERADMEINYNEKTRMVKPIRSGRDIFDYFEMAGFFFPKETLTRYFLSLRTKPFVILTAVRWEKL